MSEQSGVLVEDRFEMPITEAWPFFADFVGMPTAVPGCTATATGSGIGMVRHVTYNGLTMDEQLEVMDDEAHRVVYKIPRGTSAGTFHGYVAEMQLTPDGPDATRFRWQSHFTVADGVDPEEVREGLRTAYAFSIAAFKEALSQRRG